MSKNKNNDIYNRGERFIFCKNGDLEQLKKTFVPGMRIAIFDESEVGNLLHTAAYYGHTDIVKYLVETIKLDCNSISEEGNTPMYLAKLNNHENTVEYLCSIGVKYLTPEEALKRISFTKEDYLAYLMAQQQVNEDSSDYSDGDDVEISGLSSLNLDDNSQ